MKSVYFPKKVLLPLAIVVPLFMFFYYYVTGSAFAAEEAEKLVSEYRNFPGIPSRYVVWVVAEIHLMFGAFVLGVPIFAVIVEIIGICTKSEKYDKLAYDFTKLLPIAFTFTVIFGALTLFSLWALYPKAMNYLTEIFSPVMVIYAATFFGESICCYAYYYGWARMKRTLSLKWCHAILGVFLNLFGTLLVLLANSWLTFQMSPSGINPETFKLESLGEAINNFLWWPVNVHRLIANVAFGGAVAALYAAFRFLQTPPEEKEERAHYDWMAYTGNMIATFGLLPLPFAGYYLAFEVRSYDFALITILMGGTFAWVFILQAVLIGTMFIATNYYFWMGMNRIPGGERYKKFVLALLTIILIAFGVWMTPHTMVASLAEARKMGAAHHPLLDYFGQMPAKLTGVNLIILATFLSFVFYRRSNLIPTGSMKKQYILKGLQAFMFAAAASLVLYFGISSFPPTPKDVAIRYSIFQVLPVLTCVIVVLGIDVPLFKKCKSVGAVAWGNMPARSQYILIVIALAFSITMALMGFVRSGIRGPWHVYGVMKDTTSQAFIPPLAQSSAMMVFCALLFLALIGIVFWLTLLREVAEKKH